MYLRHITGIESLVALAIASNTFNVSAFNVAGGVPGGTSPSISGPVRPATQTAALRALLAACALPQNRAYLLLTNLIDRLAFFLLPFAVETDSQLEAACDVRSPTSPADALVLPLVNIIRLVVATSPAAEAGRKLRSDLVLVILYSGGLDSLREYAPRPFHVRAPHIATRVKRSLYLGTVVRARRPLLRPGATNHCSCNILHYCTRCCCRFTLSRRPRAPRLSRPGSRTRVCAAFLRYSAIFSSRPPSRRVPLFRPRLTGHSQELELT